MHQPFPPGPRGSVRRGRWEGEGTRWGRAQAAGHGCGTRLRAGLQAFLGCAPDDGGGEGPAGTRVGTPGPSEVVSGPCVAPSGCHYRQHHGPTLPQSASRCPDAHFVVTAARAAPPARSSAPAGPSSEGPARALGGALSPRAPPVPAGSCGGLIRARGCRPPSPGPALSESGRRRAGCRGDGKAPPAPRPRKHGSGGAAAAGRGSGGERWQVRSGAAGGVAPAPCPPCRRGALPPSRLPAAARRGGGAGSAARRTRAASRPAGEAVAGGGLPAAPGTAPPSRSGSPRRGDSPAAPSRVEPCPAEPPRPGLRRQRSLPRRPHRCRDEERREPPPPRPPCGSSTRAAKFCWTTRPRRRRRVPAARRPPPAPPPPSRPPR